MKRFLDVIFGTDSQSEDTAENRIDDVRLATTALLVEIAGIDNRYSAKERETIRNILTERFDTSVEEVDKMIAAARQEIEKQLDLHRFTKLINEHFDKAEKIAIIENVWRVIYSDKHLDGYEDQLIHRYTNLLKLDHKDMIDAKLKIKAELGL